VDETDSALWSVDKVDISSVKSSGSVDVVIRNNSCSGAAIAQSV
jgi:hypothetical protein